MATKRPPVRGLDVLAFVPFNLRRLAAAGVLSENAHSLVLQLIAKMKAERSLEVMYTMRQATTSTVFLNGRPFIGPVGWSYLEMLAAVVQAHTLVGFFNHHDHEQLRRCDPDSHFLTAVDAFYDEKDLIDMPLHFKFDAGNMDYWSDMAAQALKDAEHKYNVVEVDTLC